MSEATNTKVNPVLELRIKHTEGRRPWAAKIEGTHPDYRFERSFLEGEDEKRADGGENIVFSVYEAGYYEFCGSSGGRFYRSFHEENGALVKEKIGFEEAEEAAERLTEAAARARREAVEAVRAGETRPFLAFDVEEREHLGRKPDSDHFLGYRTYSLVPPAPDGWRLVDGPNQLGAERIQYAVYLPEDMLSETTEPDALFRRIIEYLTKAGLPAWPTIGALVSVTHDFFEHEQSHVMEDVVRDTGLQERVQEENRRKGRND